MLDSVDVHPISLDIIFPCVEQQGALTSLTLAQGSFEVAERTVSLDCPFGHPSFSNVKISTMHISPEILDHLADWFRCVLFPFRCCSQSSEVIHSGVCFACLVHYVIVRHGIWPL